MSSLQDNFVKYVKAVGALGAAFSDQADSIHANETRTQFEFSTSVENLAWLKEHLPTLVDALNPAGFKLLLSAVVHDQIFVFELQGFSSTLEVNVEEPPPDSVKVPAALPSDAVADFERFQTLVKPDETEISFKQVQGYLMTLSQLGVRIELSMQLFLDKMLVKNELLWNIDINLRPKLSVYLFPEAMVRDFESQSLSDFEGNYVAKGKRSLFVVFNLRGQARSAFVAILGGDAHETLEELLNDPLDEITLHEGDQRVEFRATQSIWLHPTNWLLPETFDLSIERSGDNDIWNKIVQNMMASKALLSIIFLADNVTQTDSIYRVEFTGFGRASIPLSKEALLEDCTSLQSLYQLYRYSYDGLSADKLEIAQQFLSLIAEDLPSLCNKSGEIREATKKTYDRALVDKVSEYFAARQKIQDRISLAVTETANKIISLSRDISSDLYKVAGVIAAATVGALLDANITTWAALLAAVVIAIYSAIVLRFHLPTISDSFKLEMQQHTIYIQSFNDILRSAEIDAFIDDQRLEETRALFEKKYSEAQLLYVIAFFLAVAVGVAIAASICCGAP